VRLSLQRAVRPWSWADRPQLARAVSVLREPPSGRGENPHCHWAAARKEFVFVRSLKRYFTPKPLLFAMAADVADAARRARSGERRGGKVTDHDLRLVLRLAKRAGALEVRVGGSNLVFNAAAVALLAPLLPRSTTLHFTFGSSVMLDFVHNWRHYVDHAGLTPAPVGAVDGLLLKACEGASIAAVAVSPSLDVWTYEVRVVAPGQALTRSVESNWAYYRHHKSSFLEMGLVKVAFLTELLGAGFSVLISDLDVVWLNGRRWRWMSYSDPAEPPLAEASLAAMADVLVSMDEIITARDGAGAFGFGSELNKGVLFFRNTSGSLALVQAWREAMKVKGVKTVEFINDQNIFNQVVNAAGLRTVEHARRGGADAWRAILSQNGQLVPGAFEAAGAAGGRLRPVRLSEAAFLPCLPSQRCEERVRFSLSTLPMRAFTNGHSGFNQDAQHAPGAELPSGAPVTVHFTFQFGDTNEYPHGKRQRAREAALWAVDPPAYFTEGVYVKLASPIRPSTLRPTWPGSTAASPSGRRSGTCIWTRRSARQCATCSRLRRPSAGS